jgi:hypothetical protein
VGSVSIQITGIMWKFSIRLYAARRPDSCNIFNAYFCWPIEMPWELRAISRPRKNFRGPMSLSWNLALRKWIISEIESFLLETQQIQNVRSIFNKEAS